MTPSSSNAGQRVDQQQRDDDLVGRRDRRQAGQHHEGHGRRQQRERRPRRPEHARRRGWSRARRSAGVV